MELPEIIDRWLLDKNIRWGRAWPLRDQWAILRPNQTIGCACENCQTFLVSEGMVAFFAAYGGDVLDPSHPDFFEKLEERLKGIESRWDENE